MDADVGARGSNARNFAGNLALVALIRFFNSDTHTAPSSDGSQIGIYYAKGVSHTELSV